MLMLSSCLGKKSQANMTAHPQTCIYLIEPHFYHQKSSIYSCSKARKTVNGNTTREMNEWTPVMGKQVQ